MLVATIHVWHLQAHTSVLTSADLVMRALSCKSAGGWVVWGLSWTVSVSLLQRGEILVNVEVQEWLHAWKDVTATASMVASFIKLTIFLQKNSILDWWLLSNVRSNGNLISAILPRIQLFETLHFYCLNKEKQSKWEHSNPVAMTTLMGRITSLSFDMYCYTHGKWTADWENPLFLWSSEYWFKTDRINYQPKTYTGESKNSNVFFRAPVGKSRWKYS